MDQIINNANYGTMVKATTTKGFSFYMSKDNFNYIFNGDAMEGIEMVEDVQHRLDEEDVYFALILDTGRHHAPAFPVANLYSVRYELEQILNTKIMIVEDY